MNNQPLTKHGLTLHTEQISGCASPVCFLVLAGPNPLTFILKGDFITKELKEQCRFFPSLWVAAKTPTCRQAGAFLPALLW